MKNIFINGPGRSGTTLMKTLLDSHPNLTVFPIEVTKYLKLFMEASQGKPEAPASELNKLLLEHFGRDYFGKVFYGQSGDDIDFTDVDPGVFESEIRNLSDIVCSPSNYLEYVQKTYSRALKPDILPSGRKAAFILQVNDPNIEPYLKYFKDSKVIYIIRHPVYCFNSKKKAYSKRVDLRPKERCDSSIVALEDIRKAFNNAEKYFSEPRVMVIRMEDLQESPTEVMRRVAGFIGVEFHDVLLSPTVLQKRYRGNILEKKKGYRIHSDLSSSSDRSFTTRYEEFIIQRYKFSRFYKEEEKKLGFGWDFFKSFPEENEFRSAILKRLFKKGTRPFVIHFSAYLILGFLSMGYYYLVYRTRLYKVISSFKRGF